MILQKNKIIILLCLIITTPNPPNPCTLLSPGLEKLWDMAEAHYQSLRGKAPAETDPAALVGTATHTTLILHSYYTQLNDLILYSKALKYLRYKKVFFLNEAFSK